VDQRKDAILREQDIIKNLQKIINMIYVDKNGKIREGKKRK
jgi:hypothetical protein